MVPVRYSPEAQSPHSPEQPESPPDLLETLLDLISLPALVFCPFTQQILCSNRAMQRYFGAAELQSIGGLWADSADGAALVEAIGQGKTLPEPACSIQHSQAKLTVLSAQPVKFQGQLAGLLTLKDSQPDRQEVSEQQAQTRHALLETAVQYAADAIEIIDADAVIEYVNPAFEQLTGYEAAEAIGQTPAALLRGGQHDEAFYQAIWQTISGGQVWRGNLTGKTKDGRSLYQEATIAPVSDADGISHYVAIKRDISQYHETKQLLEENRQQLQSIVEAAPLPLLITRISDGCILFANTHAEQILGRSAAELLGQQALEFYHDRTERARWLKQLSEDGHLQGYELQVKRADGTLIWVVFSAQILIYQTESCFLCMFREISDQKQTEQALQFHARQWAAVAEVGQRALAGLELGELLNQATQLVANVLRLRFCGVLELMANGCTLMLQAGVGWKPGLVGAATVGTQADTLFGRMLADLEPLSIADLRIETRFRCPPLLHNHRMVSSICLTIPGAEQPFGILLVGDSRSRRFSQDETYFLQSVVNVLATTISRRQAESRLRLMERAIKASSNGIVLTDALQPHQPIVYVNPAFEAMTGYGAAEVLGQNCRFLQGADRQQSGVTALRFALRQGRECHVVLRNYRKDGSLFWNELHISPVLNAAGDLTHFVGIQTDISQRKQAEADLQASQQQLDQILRSLEDIVWSFSVSSQQFLYLNPAAEKIYGRKLEEFWQRPNLAHELVHPDDQTYVDQVIQHLYQIGSSEMEYRIIRPNGEIRWLYDRARVTYDADGRPVQLDGIATDITERKWMQEKLIHYAYHDALTGLPNRTLFLGQLSETISKSKQNPEHGFAVLFLDLDRFKLVNDSFGHLVGDQLLVAIVQRLNACLQPNETLARLGGDQFIVLLNEMQQMQEATELALRIHQHLKLPFSLNNHKIFTSASIGIVFSHSRYDLPEELLRDADIALYQAKTQSKPAYAVFNAAMYDRALSLLQLETDLRWAIEREELRVYYQPIVCLATGMITGFEALIRWQHPERGLVSPTEFIPVAEETGMIRMIGQWVMQTACLQLRQWQQQLPQAADLTVSVNISSNQLLQLDLAEQVAEVLRSTELNPADLKLEITEGGIMTTAEPVTLLQQLKALHVQIYIDDFGTGYSSLSRLRQFPIDTLKIDRSFVGAMHQDRENAEIVQAILSLAHNLGLTVVAEGIETAEQAAYLRSLQCEQGQGYFFSKPLDADAAAMLIQQQPHWLSFGEQGFWL